MRPSSFAIPVVTLLLGCGDRLEEPSLKQPAARAQLTQTPADAEIVMSGLDNPRGLAFAPDGALYVAEAGRGGTAPCVVGPQGGTVCYGPTGAVSRLRDGEQSRVATGLPSLAGPTGVAQAGPNDIAFIGLGGALVTIGLQADPARRALLGGVGEGFGRLVRLAASGRWWFGVDVAAYEIAFNPDGRLNEDGTPNLDSNPFGLLAVPGSHVVTDAGGNDLLRVSANGEISLVARFQARGSTPPRSTDAVPTSVVVGPDDAYYVSELTGVSFTDGAANIYRVPSNETGRLYLTSDACIGGFKTIMDIAFDPVGNLYVLQHSTGAMGNGTPNSGVLIRVTPAAIQSDICAAYRAGTRTVVLSALNFPTSVAIGPEGNLYVTNNGRSVGTGQVLRLTIQ
jgi:hypothetical protein